MPVAPSSRVRQLYEFCGMLRPRGCRWPGLYSVYGTYQLLALSYAVAGGIYFVVVNGTALEKLQSVGISITILNGLLKQANAYFRQARVTHLLDSFDELWNQHYGDPSNRVGESRVTLLYLMDPVIRKCNKLMRFLTATGAAILFLNSVVPVVLFFLLGADRLYFPIVLPRGEQWHFIPAHLTQFILTVSPFFSNTTHNYLYFALSQQLGSYIAVVRRRLSSGFLDNETFRAHQDVIRLTSLLNKQFSHLLYFETKTVAVECSCSAYILYKVNIANGKYDSFGVNMINLLFCYFIPFIICFCGSVIKNESEGLLNASYSCEWYTKDLKTRRNLRLVMMAAYQPLKLYYKNLAVFSMELFLGILNGTYTFLNAIVWLEKAGEKMEH